MVCLVSCPRKHFWQYEIGLRKDATPVALRFGSAWARAMEAWRKGFKYQKALSIAIPEGVDLDLYDCSTIAALLAGYYDYYGLAGKSEKLVPEFEFGPVELGDETGMTLRGKIDSLGIMQNKQGVLYEDKTTSDSVDIDSDYWLRLRFNLQVLNYVCEARRAGRRVDVVWYNVVRKPSIKPKQVDELDEQGLKIVVDSKGVRQFKTVCKTVEKMVSVKGKKKPERVIEKVTAQDEPYQSANKAKGWIVKSHLETPDQYCDRLYEDTKARPEFYFCRKEIPIIDDELAQFERQRLELAHIINYMRSREIDVSFNNDYERDAGAWPRNVSENTCNFCAYKSFCLQNLSINPQQPPQGFSIQPFNPELSNATTTTT